MVEPTRKALKMRDSSALQPTDVSLPPARSVGRRRQDPEMAISSSDELGNREFGGDVAEEAHDTLSTVVNTPEQRLSKKGPAPVQEGVYRIANPDREYGLWKSECNLPCPIVTLRNTHCP